MTARGIQERGEGGIGLSHDQFGRGRAGSLPCFIDWFAFPNKLMMQQQGLTSLL